MIRRTALHSRLPSETPRAVTIARDPMGHRQPRVQGPLRQASSPIALHSRHPRLNQVHVYPQLGMRRLHHSHPAQRNRLIRRGLLSHCLLEPSRRHLCSQDRMRAHPLGLNHEGTAPSRTSYIFLMMTLRRWLHPCPPADCQRAKARRLIPSFTKTSNSSTTQPRGTRPL